MTLEEVRSALQAQGFTAMQTLGGPVALGDWHPYQSPSWHGRILAPGIVQDLLPAGYVIYAGQVEYLGIWQCVGAVSPYAAALEAVTAETEARRG